MKYSANKNPTVVVLEALSNDKYLISLSRLHLYKLIIVQVIKKLSTFCGTPNSLPCSQELVTAYPEAVKVSVHDLAYVSQLYSGVHKLLT
jgi:hypothetical protein